MVGDEKKEVEEPQDETECSSKAYFERLGLSPEVSKNTFSEEDAIAIFLKVAQDLKERRLQKNLIKKVLNRAWDVFKLLA